MEPALERPLDERAAGRGNPAPIGVLATNLGSPDAPTPAAVRRFLAEFLGDPLVVDANPVVWWLVRNLFVLPLRSRKSAALYRSVWTSEGAPLLVNARRFASALERALGSGFRVAPGMCYGSPSIAEGLAALVAAGCARVVVLQGFPQASRATTGAAERELERARAPLAPELEIELVPHYYADPGHVAALAGSVRAELARGPVDHQVFSFHGLPVRYVEAGDPYRDHCVATARALADALGLRSGEWTLAYQSRFGREPWLGPDTAEIVPALAARHARVLVTAPSFTLDCLETLEELGIRLRASFAARGGKELRLVPCLNDDARWVEAAATLVRRTASSARAGTISPR